MLANTLTAYGSISKTFHWLIALLILTVIPLGIIAYDLPYETSDQLARKALLFSMHKTVGVAIFFVALLRILWAVTQPKPCPVHPERKAEGFLAELVHWLLYGSLVLVPLTGWIHHASTEGFAPIWWPFGQNLPLVPESERVAEVTAALHKIFERVMVASLLLHIAGAMKHAVVERDGTLARMWFGFKEAGPGLAHRAGLIPPAAAVVVWIGALGIGAGLGLFAQHAEAESGVELAAVASDWDVQEGSLGLAVEQLGNTVNGEFADWTSAISFDPETGIGSVETTISIGSMTLGSVTGQALGADYLDAEAHPTARFVGAIRPEGDAFVAEGPLIIKGFEVPVILNFTLVLDGDTATAEGELRVDRRDFGVGLAMEESNLAFPVFITFNLTATRG